MYIWSARYLMFLCLYFLICKMKLMIGMLQIPNELEQCLTHTVSCHQSCYYCPVSSISISTIRWLIFPRKVIFKNNYFAIICLMFEKKLLMPVIKSSGFFFLLIIIYLFIYLFLAVLGHRFCARAFSSCGKRGPLFITVRRPLTVTASCCGAQAPDVQAQ